MLATHLPRFRDPGSHDLDICDMSRHCDICDPGNVGSGVLGLLGFLFFGNGSTPPSQGPKNGVPRQVQYASLDDRSNKEQLAFTLVWARPRGELDVTKI